jgi:NAD(P)-dependent dehydrogenase (short-subunit alcohol dehydrogenase family)
MINPNEALEQSVQQRLKGKVAVISGGGSGIGKASALLMARHGARICLFDRTLDNANQVIDEIKQAGGEAIVIHTDIAQADMVENAYKEALKAYGRLDIVFANAGINGVMTSIEHMEVDDWQKTVDINLRGTFQTVKYAIPHLKESGGSILINSSINGNRVFSNIGFSAYSTTKAGQVAFMKMAALELARYKIRVNAICPGAIDTSINDNTFKKPELKEVQIPVNFPEGDQPLAHKSGSAEQVAQLALFLASHESSHITGTEIFIDGAESLIHG